MIICVVVLCIGGLVGCPEDGGGEPDPLEIPLLITEDGVVFSNDPATIDLDWHDVSGADTYGIKLLFRSEERGYEYTPESEYYYHEADSSIPSHDLTGWSWKVQALRGSEIGPWSEERTFSFEAAPDPLEEATAALLDDSVDPGQAYQEFSNAFEAAVEEQGLEAARANVDAVIAGELKTEQDLMNWINRASQSKTKSYGRTRKVNVPEDCDTVVLFVNGICNADFDSKDSYLTLKKSVTNPNILVDYFYNPSLVSSEKSLLVGNWTILPYFSKVAFPKTWEATQSIIDDAAGAAGFVIDLSQAFAQWTQTDLDIFYGIISATNQITTIDLRDRIRGHLDDGLKVIVVPHSQGNFYTRDALLNFTSEERESVAVIETGSPSPTMTEPTHRIDVDGDWIAWFSLARHGDDGIHPDSTEGKESDPHSFQDSYMEGWSREVILEKINFYREMLLEEPVVEEVWQRTYGGDHYCWSHSIQQTSDGGYIVAGITYGFDNGKIYLVKTDSVGDEQWSKAYGGDHDCAYSVQQTSDGGYIVAGETDSFGSGGSDMYLVKTDSVGDEQWSKAYGGTGYDFAESVQLTNDRGYILAGRINGEIYSRIYVVKTDAEGNTGPNPE